MAAMYLKILFQVDKRCIVLITKQNKAKKKKTSKHHLLKQE